MAKISLYKNKIDGLIFTKINFPYLPGKNPGILKWKPDYLNTIDFLLVENTHYINKYPELFEQDDFYIFELFTIHNQNFAFFDFLFCFSSEEFINIQQQMTSLSIFNIQIQGVIVECNYDTKITNPQIQ